MNKHLKVQDNGSNSTGSNRERSSVENTSLYLFVVVCGIILYFLHSREQMYELLKIFPEVHMFYVLLEEFSAKVKKCDKSRKNVI